jgi:uncharacterized protein
VTHEPNATIQYFKYDGSEHWRIEADFVREDDVGWWLRGHPGYRATREGHPPSVEAVGFVFLVPRAAWWAGFWNFDRSGPYELYIDVATPASLEGRTFRLVDLDLDVVRTWDGDVELLDEDEFVEHSHRFGYPAEIIESARRSASELLVQVRERVPPFDLFDAATTWTDQ